MIITCGVALFNKNNELLVVHPTGSNFNTWSIPKGVHEIGVESYEETAKREFKEETGFDISYIHLKEVGDYKYPGRSKTLKGFTGYVDDIDTSLLKCNSFVQARKYTLAFPEVDGFAWISLLSYHLLHVTQLQLINNIQK